MKGIKILYRSGDVHKAVKKIFDLPCKRRVAVVAYLGANADKFLPNPNNIEIICCPEPGSTSPAAIRKLLHRGAKIRFSDGLHSKVYWSNKGCIITSANISHRALGNNPQKEVGVLINSSDFDIDRLINESHSYDITQELMNKLSKQDRKTNRAVGNKAGKSQKFPFIEWYNSPYREPWKIGWWTESILESSKAAVKKSKEVYNVSEPARFLNVSKSQASRDNWFLRFGITSKGIKQIGWMYVDFVVHVDPDEKNAYEREYPFQAIQVHKSSRYPPPPFHISKEFTKAFKSAVKEYGIEKIEYSPTLKAPKKLLDLTAKYINVNKSV